MLAPGAARQPDQAAARIHIPVRRAEAGERRNKVNAARVRHLACVVFRVAAVCEKAHLVTQPLDDRPADEYAALERILCFAADPDADRGQQAVFAFARLRSRVHEQEAAGAVGVFRIARVKAGLAEQRRLLVTCNACDRHVPAGQGNVAVDLA